MTVVKKKKKNLRMCSTVQYVYFTKYEDQSILNSTF